MNDTTTPLQKKDDPQNLENEIIALVRWLHRHQPHTFCRQPKKIGDAPRDDATVAPAPLVTDWTKERYAIIQSPKIVECPREDGLFFYSWEVRTIQPGLAVNIHGSLLSIVHTGSARLGSFSSNPCECNRNIAIAYQDIRAPTPAHLRSAIEWLRRRKKCAERATPQLT